MYNEILKTNFIREYTNSIKTADACMRVFNAVEKYEIKWNADICTKSERELQPIIDEFIGVRRGKSINLTILKDYVKWCVVTDVPGACDGMMRVNSAGLNKIKYQTVSSPAHLERYLNTICEPVEEQATDSIYRCYYWLAYAGVPEDDILQIRCRDIDFVKMVVRYKDVELPIYREAVPAFKNCVELAQFKFNHPNYSKDVWKDRVPGDTVIRGVRALPSTKAMRVELSRRSKNKRDKGMTDLKLSYYRVWISGLFHRTYEKEMMGIQPDFRDVVYHQVAGKSYKLDSGRNTQEAKHRQLIRDYLEDYQRWKLAFGMGGCGAQTLLETQTVDFPHEPLTWQEFKNMREDLQVAYMRNLLDTYEVFYKDLAIMFRCSAQSVKNFCEKYKLSGGSRRGKRIYPEKREEFYKFAGIDCYLTESTSSDYLNRPVKWSEFKKWSHSAQVEYMQHLIDTFSVSVPDAAKMFDCGISVIYKFCTEEGIALNSKGRSEKRDVFYEFAGIKR